MKTTRTLRVFPMVWLLGWFTTAIAVSLSASSPNEHQLELTLQAGHDAFGRALLPLTMTASLMSSAFALIIALGAVLTGVTLGAVTALTSRRISFFLARGNELFLAFPSLVFALSCAALRGPGWDTLAVSLAVGILPPFTRLMQTRAMELSREEYVTAARALGAGSTRIAWRHLMPSLASTAAIKLPSLFAQALIAEATFSFLGVGAPVGRETWGSLLAQGKDYLIEAPRIAVTTGLPLVITVLSLQLLSEGLGQKPLRSGHGLS